MLERATRLCWISPRMVTFSPSSVPLRSRMVSASSRPCEGCSCVPSPALITGISRCRATKSAAPEAAWRITRQSGFMALSVCTVSNSDSPFFRLEASTWRFMVSAPRRDAAVPKLMRVRVELSKKAKATVLPRKVASFFRGWRWISWKGLLWSRRNVSSPAVSRSSASRSRKRCVTFSFGSVTLTHTCHPEAIPQRIAEGSQRKHYRHVSDELSVHAVNQHHALFAVNFAKPHLDNFGVARLHHAPGKLRLNRHFSVAAIDQHAERASLGSPKIEKSVHRRADGAPGIQNVIH